ncbi:MAG: radical SAM protein [Candidatus Alcyoniella australis]|nr:radical SAM protein [Candidatus Alcyoniella australis]
MERDLSRNPALLKLELYCKGMRIDDSCKRLDDDGRPILRTRAGLGSGLELVLPHGLWTNVPVLEKFAHTSPFALVHRDGEYLIERDGKPVSSVQIPPEPAFYRRLTSSGRLMSRVGVLQGTYLGIYPTGICAHWLREPRVNCTFCSVGLNLGNQEEQEKSIQEVVETTLAAMEEVGITYVHFNTGYYDGDTYLDELEPFIKAVKRETGLLIGVQTPPHPDLKRYDRLRRMGVNQVSFCFELWDRDCFVKQCPGKAEKVGIERYLDAIAYCAPIFDTTNGEIIAGLEPVATTLEAVEWITDVGAIPTVCVFRPLRGTDLEDHPPPDSEELIPVFKRLYESCMEKKLPLGIAPNINVSIILKPEECRWFSDDPGRFWKQDLKALLMRQALKGLLGVQQRRAWLYRRIGI